MGKIAKPLISSGAAEKPGETAINKSLSASKVLGFALARTFHESPAATADMGVLPGVLGCRIFDVPFRYASGPTPCGCPVASPSLRSRDGNS